jgi:hypothetical protein
MSAVWLARAGTRAFGAIRSLLLSPLLLLFATAAIAADVVISHAPPANWGTDGVCYVAQSFKATKTGLLKSIGIASELDYWTPVGTATLVVYSGEGIGGSQLYSKTGISFAGIDTVNTGSDYTFHTITIDSAVPLVSGQSYTFFFLPPAAIALAGHDGTLAAGYPDGRMYTPFDDVYCPDINANYDLAFQVTQGDSPVSITSIDPTSGSTAGGTLVMIHGSGFTGATSLTIGGVAPAYLSWGVLDANTIYAYTPASATAGAKDVVVVTPLGTATGTGLFTYKYTQAITFSDPPDQYFGTSPTLTATATSGLVVTFTSSTPGRCTITTGGTLTFVAEGNCTINADQAGNASYLAAATVTQTLFVYSIVPGAPTIGTATAGNAQATVAFTAPASNGGAAISSYRATSNPGGLTGTCASSPCTVTGLTNGTAYTFTVTATNNAGTGPPSAASNSVTPMGTQTISFGQPADRWWGTAPPTLTATASSGLAVTFTSSTPAVCTITSGGALTYVSAGTCTINADQSGNAYYLPAPTVTRSFTISGYQPGAPTGATATAGNTEAYVNFTAPADNGGYAITLYTATSTPGSLTGTCAGPAACQITVTGLTNGTAYTFRVQGTNSAGPGTPSAASNSVTPKAPQTITFANPGPQGIGTPPTLTATASSSLAVSFTSSTTGVCTITSGGVLTFLSAGTCTINADQAGNTAWLAAPTVTQSFAVNAGVPGAPIIGTATAGNGQASIAFTPPASNGGSAIIGYTATSNPDGATGTAASSPITVSGLTNGTAYTFTVTATNSAGTGPSSAASNSVVPAAPQSVTFNNPGAQMFGTTPTLTATATSGLTVSFTSNTTGVCTITSGGALTLVSAGTCSINADQAGNGSFLAAPTVTQSFTVNPTLPGPPTGVTATAGNGQVSIAFTPPAYTGGTTITSYRATQSPGGDTNTAWSSPFIWSGLTNGVAYTFTMQAINSVGAGPASAASNSVTPKAPQTITFANPGSQSLGTSPTLTATATSGLTVSFSSSTTGVCTATSGGALTFVATGMCTINADQAGSSAWLAAPTVTQTFTVVSQTYTVTYNGNGNTGGAAPTDGTAYSAGATVTVLGNTAGLTKTGSSFSGWNTAANGSGMGYSAGTTFTINANTTLYAQWTANAPASLTGAASAISATAATLNGTVNDNGLATSASFEYGTTLAYGGTVSATPSSVPAGSGATSVSAAIGGLACNTTYHFRVKAVSAGGTTNGSDGSFTTVACAPAVTSISPNIGSTTGGTAVTISGANFSGATAVNIGGNPVTSFTVIGATSIGAVTPAGTSGAKDVVVVTPGGTATGAGLFTYMSPQTITFNNPGAQSFGTSPTLAAVASSGLTVSFISSTTGVCTVTAGGALTFLTTGTCTINADQAGNSTYSAAPTVTRSFAVNAVVPGAPTIGTATAGDAQATITLAAPASNGGAAITGYTATSNPGGLTGAAASSPIAVTGLTNGVAYTFTVTATNSAGTGPASAASNSVTPRAAQTITFNNPGTQTFGTSPTLSATASSGLPVSFSSSTTGVCTITSGGTLTFVTTGTCTINADQVGNAAWLAAPTVTQSFPVNAGVPGAPTGASATPALGSATVTFTAPASNGGSAITSYTATSSPGGLTGTCAGPAACTVTVMGLANGQPYTFSVTATNAVGTGPASAASNSVTPAGPPNPPTIGTATAGNAQATVSFTPPTSDNGSAINGYTATSNPGGITSTAASSPITVTGLTNGLAYTFTVTATNAMGTGASSAASNSVTPKAPQTITFANPGPRSFGTTPTLAATASSGLTVSFSSSTTGVCTITGGGTLTFVTTGTCTINADQAGNAAFLAAPTVTQSFTVSAVVPGAPTGVAASAGNAQATVNFTAPASNGGSAITIYTAASNPGGLTGTCAGPAACAIIISGLTNGTAYTFTVTAANSVGTGPASAASSSVTPGGAPGAPTGVTATAGNAQATVSFTAPSSNGGSAITAYTATSSPGGLTGTCAGPAACTITVSGLANGTAYTFTVKATNSAGTGPASAASNSVTPKASQTITFNNPGPRSFGTSPTLTATASSGLAVSFTSSTTGVCTITSDGALTLVTVGTCTINADQAGNSNYLAAPRVTQSFAVNAVVPGAPVIGTATAGNAQISVAFAAPASNGGSPILDYTATCGTKSATGTTSPIVVPGLANGTGYTCRVVARNAQGTSAPSSPSNSVTPAASSVSGASATGSGTITASFTGGGDGCTFATTQFIGAPPGSGPVPPTAPPGVTFPHGMFDFTTSGCSPASTLTFTIVYPTPLPAGTHYWKYGPTPDEPTPHWYTLPATISGNTATFSIADGGLGDDDLVANGAVVDQGGPGVGGGGGGSAAAIPTLSEWAMILLSMLLLAAGARAVGTHARR